MYATLKYHFDCELIVVACKYVALALRDLIQAMHLYCSGKLLFVDMNCVVHPFKPHNILCLSILHKR